MMQLLTSQREDSLARIIREHPFLAGMNGAHLEVLRECAMRTTFARGSLIFREGDLANRFYLIESGRVALELRNEDGRPPTRVQELHAGDALGWSWLFPPYYWHYNAHALTRTTAIFFYGTRLRNECEEDHSFGYELMKRMAAVAIQRLEAHRAKLPPTHLVVRRKWSSRVAN